MQIHMTMPCLLIAMMGGSAMAANIAPNATVTVSSTLSPAPVGNPDAYLSSNATDEDLSTAWVAHQSEGLPNEITLTWDTAQSISEFEYTLAGTTDLGDSKWWSQSWTLEALSDEAVYETIATVAHWDEAAPSWTYAPAVAFETTSLRLIITSPTRMHYDNVGNARTLTYNNRARVAELAVEGFPVPEPASLALLAMGGAMLVARRRANVVKA